MFCSVLCSDVRKVFVFCSVLCSSAVFCVFIVLVIIRVGQIRTLKILKPRTQTRTQTPNKFKNGWNRVNTVCLSESAWSKKTDHVRVAGGITLDCDTISGVGVKVKVNGICEGVPHLALVLGLKHTVLTENVRSPAQNLRSLAKKYGPELKLKVPIYREDYCSRTCVLCSFIPAVHPLLKGPSTLWHGRPL